MGYIKLNGQSIHIDRRLMYIIKTLNEKGYETFGCCEGHWQKIYPRYSDTFIWFTYGVPPLDYIFDHLSDLGIDTIIRAEHDTRKKDTDFMLIQDDKIIRFWMLNNPSDRWHKSRQHSKIIKLLKEWADILPYKE